MHLDSFKVLIKYCGGCNPLIDRVKIVRLLMDRLKGDIQAVSSETDTADIVLLVCGCPTCCADTSELTEKGLNKIVISGPGVDYVSMNENNIVGFLIQKIKDLKQKELQKSPENL